MRSPSKEEGIPGGVCTPGSGAPEVISGRLSLTCLSDRLFTSSDPIWRHTPTAPCLMAVSQCMLSLSQDFLLLLRREKHHDPPSVHRWVHCKCREVSVLRGESLGRAHTFFSIRPQAPNLTDHLETVWSLHVAPWDQQSVALESKCWPVWGGILCWLPLFSFPPGSLSSREAFASGSAMSSAVEDCFFLSFLIKGS